MSKLKLVSVNNEIQLSERDEEAKGLDKDLTKALEIGVLTNRDLVAYSYHFTRLEHPLLAQKYLNKVSSEYFSREIWIDLFQGMLAWSIAQATPNVASEAIVSSFEYFLVVKRGIQEFEKLSFQEKSEFLKFKDEFQTRMLFTN